MARPNEAEFLRYALKGNVAAVAFCQSIFRISQIWDDLVDRDVGVSNELIDEAFWRALIEIPENPFYRDNAMELIPLLRQYISDWFEANALEKSGVRGKQISFVLRDSIGALITQCAYLIGGYEWMRAVSTQVRDHIFDEDFDTYMTSLDVVEDEPES